jgi:hypothetical protein
VAGSVWLGALGEMRLRFPDWEMVRRSRARLMTETPDEGLGLMRWACREPRGKRRARVTSEGRQKPCQKSHFADRSTLVLDADSSRALLQPIGAAAEVQNRCPADGPRHVRVSLLKYLLLYDFSK